MREIKFRFWNGKKMIQPTEWADVLIKGDGRIFTWIDISENSGLHEDENGRLIPMQFTGLIDRKRKGIYEGDICKMIHEGVVRLGIISFNYYGVKLLSLLNQDVDFVYDVLPPNMGAWTESNEIDSSDLKVVGNIYENSDLLK